ncbi:MAG: type IV pilin protein [Candidatus Acidiferrales bacterium]
MTHTSRIREGRQIRNGSAGISGFSLIELLIVVAVILIIAGIAIPNFLQSKMAANEAAAIANTRTITTSNVVYSTTYGIGYAASLAKMATPPAPAPVNANAAGLLDNILAAGTKSGYAYTYVAGPVSASGTIDAYTLQADPLAPTITGTRHFFVDATGVIRFNSAAAAGPADPPVQ